MNWLITANKKPAFVWWLYNCDDLSIYIIIPGQESMSNKLSTATKNPAVVRGF